MPQVAHGSTAAVIEEAARTIEAEFGVAMGSATRVASSCDVLREHSEQWDRDPALAQLERLAALVVGRTSPLVEPLFALLAEAARASPRPWRLLEPMLRTGAPELVTRALDELVSALEVGRLSADAPLLASLAAIAEEPISPLAGSALLERLACIVGNGALDHYVSSTDPATRRLAARVLDLSGRPPASAVASQVLGPALDPLAPYLQYTRATHADLLAIADPNGEPPLLRSLLAAEAQCGPALLCQVIASLGWRSVNRGLEAKPLVGIAIAGGIPLIVSRDEASFFDGCPAAQRVFERTLFVAHGEHPERRGVTAGGEGRIARFRASNLAHARVLGEFLDLSPLTGERVTALLEDVGALVADFVALFPDERDECREIQASYDGLRARILAVGPPSGIPVPADVVRLVQPFEDPATAAEVRSLHGLKRYLHQRALRHGFKLVQPGRHATRTVSLVVTSNDRVIEATRPIEYADFEEGDGEPLPYSVRVVVDAFASQLLHGNDKLPLARVFCYGNEVHYFLSFRNHPAFVRVDYSPPFAGGMIDLEYYGVSKYELSQHPGVALDGIRACFTRLDFDVSIDNTRIHARYDKERARDLSDLCARVEALFRLAPYLMDIDWVLGNLDLSREALGIAAEAWADRLARWGVLPLAEMLTPDRRGIRDTDEPHPSGPRLRTWRGDRPYRDRFTPDPAVDLAGWLREALHARGLEVQPILAGGELAQLAYERSVVGPWRASIVPGGRQPLHEARAFAELLQQGAAALERAARVARVIAPIERFLTFETTGAVNGHEVQRARFVLPERSVTLFVLRDDLGNACAALTAESSAIWRAGDADMTWAARSSDAFALTAMLRARNFPVGDPGAAGDVDTVALAAAIAAPARHPPVRPLDGERLARGVRAAPGAAAGLARLGSAHRSARDLEGTIFVTDRLSPDDGPFLVRAAGVVCTGGGVLSHAGLLAAQFAKPALMIDARWNAPADAGTVLQFAAVEYDEAEITIGPHTVAERFHLRAHDEPIHDGDLLDLNADEGIVRVLGQDRETLALHDALRELSASDARLVSAATPEHVLVERGRRAHAVHQLERLLARVERPDLAAYAVRQLLASPAAADSRASLLRLLLGGPASKVAHRCLRDRLSQLEAAYASASREARDRMPKADDPFEVLALRLALRGHAEALDTGRSILRSAALSDRTIVSEGAMHRASLASLDDEAALDRLRILHQRDLCKLRSAMAAHEWAHVRHLLEAVQRDGAILPAEPASSVAAASGARDRLRDRDRVVLGECVGRRIVGPDAGGGELAPLIGAKAANLAEVKRLAPAAAVPPWFAVTDAAFRDVLARAAPGHIGQSVAAAIDTILLRPGADDGQRSRAIADIWEELQLPADLEGQIRDAYGRLSLLAREDPDAPADAAGALLVAVRSSAFEEDTRMASRAGDFETFLFVAGEGALISHVKRAWSGLWTPRAIHHRAVLGDGEHVPGGGILVQRCIAARAAGVVQTINVADRRPRELSINAAFGLGQGVVSGLVAADHVIVAKDRAGGPLRFRYATADKRERVIFDARRGSGTVRGETLYHQRMRPALEYADLEDIVATAEQLERLWHQALDIEFALDARRLWILQARPIPAYHAAWRETARHHPLIARRADP